MAKGTSRLARNAALLAAGFVAAVASLARPDLARDEVVARYAGPTSRFASIEGMQVHYRDEGQGPPLLLLHGTSSSLHTWDGWTQRIGAGRRIVRLDLPGFGLTGPAPDHDYRSTRLARVARTLLDQLHVERADVAGNSLGGRVALTLASETPERVRGLVLVDAAGMSGQAPPPIFRLARTPVLGGLLRWITPRFLVKKNVREVYGDASRVSEPLVDRYYDLARREGNREALLRRLDGPRDPDLDDILPRIAAPTLVQWGEKDVWIAESFGRRIAAGIPNAKLVVYPGAGHVPMEEIPDETARDADAFLAR